MRHHCLVLQAAARWVIVTLALVVVVPSHLHFVLSRRRRTRQLPSPSRRPPRRLPLHPLRTCPRPHMSCASKSDYSARDVRYRPPDGQPVQ